MGSEDGRILRIQGGFYFVDTKKGERVASLPGKHKRGDFTLLPGDLVRIDQQGEDWIIGSWEPRRNYLDRPGVANLDALLVVASIVDPPPDYLLMDRLLALGLYANMKVAILGSKVDLLEDQGQAFRSFASYYRQTGFSIFPSPKEDSFSQLRKLFSGHTVALAGNSGVGKSTFLNLLFGEEVTSVKTVSDRLKRGRHTTRTVTFFPYQKGYLVDSPGFNVLTLPKDLEPVQLARLYPDYLPYLEDCRFSNCLHDREPGCKIRAGVQAGYLSQRRYHNYLHLLQEAKDVSH